MKSALILEGGAMRAIYDAGVFDVLMENDIETDLCIGVSAGALFGINYKSKQPGRVLRYNLKYSTDHRFVGWRSLLKTGDLMDKQFYFDDLPYRLDPMDIETYKNNKMQFKAVVTNLKTGKAEYPDIYDIADYKCMEYLRASGSLPFLSKNVVIDGTPYLDGGVADSVPVEYCLKEDYDKLIVVLTRPYGFRKSGDIKLTKLFYKEHPQFCETLKNRNYIYSKQYDLIDKLEKQGKIFVIRPTKVIKTKATEKNPDVLNALYNLGRKDCEDVLQKLIEYLNTQNPR